MGFQLLNRDCLEAIRKMPAESVDAIVTDPPYALTQASRKGSSRKPGTGPFGRHTLGEDRGFMGKTWDNGALVHDPAFWAEVLRIAKPGAHLIAFGGTRTFHRLMVAIEDAGWEIRDTLGWLYGSGFPKSLDVSKAIDKAEDVEREIVGIKKHPTLKITSEKSIGANASHGSNEMAREWALTAPATDAARQWAGWGTSLKPAWEPIILARKPFPGTVAENVQAHGTGALNIDACRVPFAGEDDEQEAKAKNQHGDFGSGQRGNRVYGEDANDRTNYTAPGRFPANIIHDGSDEALACFPDTVSRGHFPASRPAGGISCDGHSAQTGLPERHFNTGSAARFFYCAKASRLERGEGNGHPTVKPQKLMSYLCRLITPPGGTILDCFMGSGSTGAAALQEGFSFIGIEKEAEYFEIAKKRIEHVHIEVDKQAYLFKS